MAFIKTEKEEANKEKKNKEGRQKWGIKKINKSQHGSKRKEIWFETPQVKYDMRHQNMERTLSFTSFNSCDHCISMENQTMKKTDHVHNCARQFNVSLTQAGLDGDKGTSIEKMHS